MKKLHAGHYITIFFIFFISMLVTVLIASRNQDHNLVSENYYDLDLKYQKRMDAKNNLAAYPNKVILQQNSDGKTIDLMFKNIESTVNGKIKFYRPSDNTRDFDVDLKLDEIGKISLSTENMQSGRWILIIDWTEGDTPFYKEFNLFI
jgi:nitrogen fixation protein FixH